MNIRVALLNHYSKASTRRIFHYVANDPSRFKELMQAFLTGPYRVTQRAATAVELCVRNNSALINNYFPELIAILKKSDDHSLLRNILRMLQFANIPEKYKGRIVDICFSLLADSKAPVAVRVFSMTVAANISYNLPEIKSELKLMIEARLPYESAGFVARGKKIVKQLSRD